MASTLTKYLNTLTDTQQSTRTRLRNKLIDYSRSYEKAKNTRSADTYKMERFTHSVEYHTKTLNTFLETKQKKIDEFLKKLQDEEDNLRALVELNTTRLKNEKNRKTTKMISIETDYNNAVKDYRTLFWKDPEPLPTLEDSEEETPREEVKVDWSQVELPEEREAKKLKEAALAEDAALRRQVEEQNRKREELKKALEEDGTKYKNESEEDEEETVARPGSGGFPPIITHTTKPTKGIKKIVRK